MNIKRNVSKVLFAVKKKSPEILVISGVIGSATAAVLACRATLRLEDVIDPHKEELAYLHADKTSETYKKDIAATYGKMALDLIKLYGPSVTLGIASAGCIFASHNMMSKRNMALASAYSALDEVFNKYRNNVKEKFGDAVDQEMRYGLKEETVEEIVTDEDGKKKKVKSKVQVLNSKDLGSPYAVLFVRPNPNWENDKVYRDNFIHCQESYANDLLVANGYIFLNDIYKNLGFEPTKAGQFVGWTYDDPNNGEENADNFVAFDVHDISVRDENSGELIPAVIIDFNVDGNIIDKVF